MALCQASVLKVYQAVIDDVIEKVRDAFVDEGVEDQVLQELKNVWRTKLMASKAIELNPEPNDSLPPPRVANKPKPSKAANAKAKRATNAKAKKPAAVASQQSTNTPPSGRKLVTASVKQQNTTKPPSGTKLSTTSVTKNSLTGGKKAASVKLPLAPATGRGGIKNRFMEQKVTSKNALPLQPTTGGSSISFFASLDPNHIMPVNLTLPFVAGNTEPRVLTIQLPASALQENQLEQILTAQLITSLMSLPTTQASSVLQQYVNAALSSVNCQKSVGAAKQLDGALDSSDENVSEGSDDDMDNYDNDDLDKDNDDKAEHEDVTEEEPPLNSDDDMTDEDTIETDNLIVCQFDKVTRYRDKFKFYLKDGIMNMRGKDFVFQKLNGDAEF